MPETTQRPASEKEARDVAERARQSEWTQPSFLRELFLGHFRLDLVQPYPADDPDEAARAQPFLDGLRELLNEVDSDEIDRTGVIPEWVMQRLRELGAFGIKIPTEYGGLGLGQVSYVRALALVASKDASINTWLSAHQSIGVPQPLKMLGTPEQKQRFLPRLAKGAVSAFALTEVDAGSDPANMRTTATPTEDGKAFLLNGEKLWCTNGPDAELMVVMALTQGKSKDGKPGRKQITAFIVEANSPGVEVSYRCEFMGSEGHFQRDHPLHQRAGSARKRTGHRRRWTEAGADDTQHRPPDIGRDRRRRLQGDVAYVARVGERAGPVGTADR